MMEGTEDRYSYRMSFKNVTTKNRLSELVDDSEENYNENQELRLGVN